MDDKPYESGYDDGRMGRPSKNRYRSGYAIYRYDEGYKFGAYIRKRALDAAQQLHQAELLSSACPECGGSVGNHHVLCPLA